MSVCSRAAQGSNQTREGLESPGFSRGEDVNDKDREFVNTHIDQAINSCFYGEIRVVFQQGRVKRLTKEQSFTPAK